MNWFAVDWGTSRLRVWALDDKGRETGSATSDDGMGRLAPEQFEAAFLRCAANLLPPEGRVQVLICGMAGARAGWHEAPYSAVPCAPAAPPRRIPAKDPRLNVRILPGLCQTSPPDVMRGEETQIAGLLAQDPEFGGIVCLPGTHTKWVRVHNAQVVGFRTAMTGEVFDLISARSTLAGFVDQGWQESAFDDEADQAARDPANLAIDLFSLRAKALLTGHEDGAMRARLSGRLIGAEVAAMGRLWPFETVTLLGDPELCALYARALRVNNVDSHMHNAEAATLAGLRAAFQQYPGDPE